MIQSLIAGGTLAALNDAIALDVAGFGGVVVQLSGTFTATMTFEGTADNENWVPLNAVKSNGAASVTTANTTGAWFITTTGLVKARVRCSTYSSGQVQVALRSAPAAPGGSGGGGGGGGAVTIADGSDVAEGTTTDPAATDSTSPWTVISLLKGLWALLNGTLTVTGSLSIAPTTSATTARTNTAASTSSVTVLAANANRLAFTLFNDSDKKMYVKCGTTASTSSFDAELLPNDRWGTKDLSVNYTGKVDAIWEAGVTGNARATEFTA